MASESDDYVPCPNCGQRCDAERCDCTCIQRPTVPLGRVLTGPGPSSRLEDGWVRCSTCGTESPNVLTLRGHACETTRG
jgi:DNA-directed RNA polymerase subunit RPC12/RpoP